MKTDPDSRRQLAIHGMLHSHNFGDVLLAAAFRKWALEAAPGLDVVFRWARQKCLDDIQAAEPERPIPTASDYRKSPILFCGGQYVNDGNSTRGAYRRFRNIQGKGVYGRLYGERYAAFGIGIGPVGTVAGKLLNAVFLRSADLVAVREQDSYQLALKLGVSEKKLVLVADAAIAYVDGLEGLKKASPKEQERTLLLHISLANEGLVRGVEKYLKSNAALYDRILITADKFGRSPIKVVQATLLEAGIASTIVPYRNHMDLVALINRSDDVLTTKYHVGIVAGTLGKRVCAVPWNYYKVQRFYSEIGFPSHCQALAEADSHLVVNLLQTGFLNSAPIKVSRMMQERSLNNKSLVKRWISSGQ